MTAPKHKRAKNITGKEYRILAGEALRTPREPRTELARRLASETEWRGPAPSVEVLEKKITDIRKRAAEFARLDAPWSVVTMAAHEYELPPDTLPIVMKMGQYFRQREGRPMTIREALWTARLSALHKNAVRFKDYAGYVIDYAALEKLNEAFGRDEGDEMVTDSEMYSDMTGMGRDDPVTDADGKEQGSRASNLLRKGLEEKEERGPETGEATPPTRCFGLRASSMTRWVR